ncbi:MAG: ABC transporter substrate-binding protein [Akkermansiaceae bacterium]|nr:ABC transporter substrate-binding protein [Akkermansiaceae bacterium]
MIFKRIAIAALAALLLPTCSDSAPQAREGEVVLRFGHFPNLTHVQGLVAHQLSRRGQGWYERRVAELLGKPVRLTWYSYNAGPGAMEALFAHSLDLTYVGPAPVINAFVKARGREVRLLAGAVKGGSALVVPAGSTAVRPQDFRGRILATPQLGNTQDVACRAWLASAGLRISLTGGDAQVMPTRNPEQLALFARGHFAGVWTVEPWVSRLVQESGGKVLVEDSGSVATVLAAGERFLAEQPEVAAAVYTAHRELSQWIVEHPEEAQQLVIAELRELTKSSIPPELVRAAWQRIHIVTELQLPVLQQFARDAHAAGFLRQEPDLAPLIASLPATAHE